MSDLHVAALIPAAGMSSRVKVFKPLLDLGGQTLIERVVKLFESAGVSDVVTVVGHRREDLMPVLARTVSRWVFNPDYRGGMFTSIQQGLRELRQSCDAFFVLPVDTPLVRPLTVQHLMEVFGRRSSLVCYPQFKSERGHPPLIDSRLIDDILAYDGQGGLRVFLRKYSDRAETVPVADPYIVMDLDTGKDLEKLRRAFERYTIPSPAECEIMLAHYFSVPSGIEAHSRRVARVARRLGAALNDSGRSYDLDLLTAAGILHDVYKGQRDHAGKAAAWLRNAGFPEAADIVAEHMDLNTGANETLDERALLYLADMTVEGDDIVDLGTRESATMEKYAHDAGVRRKISARYDAAQKIKSRIEEITGSSLEKILSDL